MDAQTQQFFAQMQAQINNLSAQLRKNQRESVYAPSSNDPYVVPGPRDFYSYTAPILALAAGATAPATIAIEADSFFYMNAMSYQADVAAGALTESTNIIPLVTLTILDTGSGRQLMAQPVPMGAIMGDGKRPFRLPKPRRFAPTSQIILTAVNYSAATAYNLRITISGFKVYSQIQIAANGPVGS